MSSSDKCSPSNIDKRHIVIRNSLPTSYIFCFTFSSSLGLWDPFAYLFSNPSTVSSVNEDTTKIQRISKRQRAYFTSEWCWHDIFLFFISGTGYRWSLGLSICFLSSPSASPSAFLFISSLLSVCSSRDLEKESSSPRCNRRCINKKR